MNLMIWPTREINRQKKLTALHIGDTLLLVRCSCTIAETGNFQVRFAWTLMWNRIVHRMFFDDAVSATRFGGSSITWIDIWLICLYFVNVPRTHCQLCADKSQNTPVTTCTEGRLVESSARRRQRRRSLDIDFQNQNRQHH